MKNKAFTLVELLAVIVILVIIALIAVPRIYNVIIGANDKGNLMSAELYKQAVEASLARYRLEKKVPNTTCYILAGGNLDCDGEIIEVDANNSDQIRRGGTVTFYDNDILAIKKLNIAGTLYKLKNGEMIVMGPTDSSCFLYKTEELIDYDIESESCESTVIYLMISMGSSAEEIQSSEGQYIINTICSGKEGVDAVSATLGVDIAFYLDNEGILINKQANPLNSATVISYTCDDEDIIIPNKLGGKNVTEISARAFYGRNLTSVVLPNTVTTIGNRAFEYNQLAEVTIPNSVTTIGDNAFEYNQLAEVTLGTSLTTIGYAAFWGNNLTSVTIPNSVTTIGGTAFFDNQIENLTIGNGVTTIGNSAFYNNKLESLTIPNSVTTIERSAFMYNKLAELTLGSSVKTIGDTAFYANNLTSVTIPNSVTTIGRSAFMYNKLTELTLGSSVTTIGDTAFDCGYHKGYIDEEEVTYGSNALTKVTLVGRNSTEEIDEYGSGVFCWVSGKSDANINE